MGQEVIPNKPWNKPRLSPDVQPTLYNLSLYPILRSGVFQGKNTITLNVKSPQEHLCVHIKGLNISKTELHIDNELGTPVELEESFEYEVNEFWVVVPKNEIQPGSYKLYLEFEGKLTDKIVGFYRSIYKNENGEERCIATTKFEPTFARQAFPCLDEPNFKAKYDIELIKPSADGYIALSNMDKIDEFENKPEVGLTTVKFRTSFPMSTYLACFIICDFGNLDPVKTEKGFFITVYARKEQVDNVEYASGIAASVTNYYIDYFKIDYPLPKLAIPDFVSGAMENWGLITFRETRLLCKENISSVVTQLAVALTVSHEIAHMWFGDLVTMKWWNDLWLNEGFATFMEYKAVAKIHPDWDLDTIFLIEEMFYVFKLDSVLSSHPIVQPVSHPDQITEIFDSISYNKGASVLRMLEATVGEEQFREGVTSYMNEFKYANAETQDLWKHLNQFTEIDIFSFMDTWTQQMGFPMISVSVTDKNITFSQKRFLMDKTAQYNPDESPFRYRWDVPITFILSTSHRTVERVWLKKGDEKIVFNLPSKIDWVKVNIHSHGYYVVNYETQMWEKLRQLLEINFKIIDPADRASLLNDAFNMADSENISYDIALQMTKYLPVENHYVPWTVACSNFLKLNKRLYATDAYDPFTKYVNSLIKDLKVISWEMDVDSTYLQKSYQNVIIHLGCEIGNSICLNQAKTLFKQWLSMPAMKLNPEFEQMVLCFGINQTGETEWDALWELFIKEENPQFKVKIMKALCSTKDTQIIAKYLHLAKDEKYVRSQDYLILIEVASQNSTAAPIVWDFVRNEWEYLVQRYTLNDRYLGKLIAEITSNFATESQTSQMEDFFQRYPEAGAGAAARKRALERVQNNLKWRLKHYSKLNEWFVNNPK